MIYMPEKVYIIEDGKNVKEVRVNSWTKKDFSVNFYNGKFIVCYGGSYICYNTSKEAKAVINEDN